MPKQECVAMILAGGQGSRLEVLTKNVAKPAVPFGGKYRIIDFTLSNCANSGIETVGVLTQYQPLALNSYIGIGRPWDLDRNHGGVSVLPPYVKPGGGEWYSGTANAVYQNIEFIESYDPEYLLVLSGDHIYKMDYSKLIRQHKAKNAVATIAVVEVPWYEANRFGIMNTDQSERIIEFDEKPANPKNNLASMGIYIFDWQNLKKWLQEDEADSNSANDFGKDVIPKMLNRGERVYSYAFTGYWKDVGTLESLWEANMDLLGKHPKFKLNDPSWRIYSVNPTMPPQFITNASQVNNSLISEGGYILGKVKNSVIFPGVFIGENSQVVNSVIMPNAKISDNVYVYNSIIGSGTVIEKASFIGDQDLGNGLTVIGESLNIPEKSVIHGIDEQKEG